MNSIPCNLTCNHLHRPLQAWLRLWCSNLSYSWLSDESCCLKLIVINKSITTWIYPDTITYYIILLLKGQGRRGRDVLLICNEVPQFWKKCKFSPTIPGHKPFLFKGISSKGDKGGKSLVKMAWFFESMLCFWLNTSQFPLVTSHVNTILDNIGMKIYCAG